MRLLLTFFALCALLAPQSALAETERVEDITQKIMELLKTEDFKAAEAIFDKLKQQNIITRHGTDMTNAIFNHMTAQVEDTKTFTEWKEYANKWSLASPDRFIPTFLLRRLKHHEAWYYQNSEEWDTIQQSQQRKYKAVLSGSYTLLYRLNKKHPKEWRGHSYLVKNFKKFKLTAEELREHYHKAKTLNPYEISNMTGYINSLSPYALGRNDDAIVAGIEAVLKRYPEKNLSKPEYINDTIKQEIEDAIFEFMVGEMLREAYHLTQKAPKNSAAPILIPSAYKTINDDIKHYYRNNQDAANKHPLSYSNANVLKQIENSYVQLETKFPKSGKYLTERLEMKLRQRDIAASGIIIEKIAQNDPQYAPAKLQPMLCKYHSNIKADKRAETTIDQMYETCKSATQYINEQLFFYRAGWAARQKKDFSASNTFIEKALKFDPKNDVYMTDMCWNYKDLQDYNKALDYCDKAIEENPKNARAWLGRSHIYYYGFKNTEQSQKDAMMYERLRKK